MSNDETKRLLIKTAAFDKSSQTVQACPDTKLPEYAFIGRSNVGKSSLINMLTNNKKLAKTSSTPGKTQLINHFLINESWYIADLPGYGYAKVSKSQREKWGDMIDNYLFNRENLMCTFVLIDIRHEPQKIDVEFINWLGEKELPLGIIFTKADKLKRNQLAKNLAHYRDYLHQFWQELPPHFVTSSESKTGREEVIDYIVTVNESLI